MSFLLISKKIRKIAPAKNSVLKTLKQLIIKIYTLTERT